MQIHLNPDLDRRAAQSAYKRAGRIHVPNVLHADSALVLHDMLSKKLTYDQVFRGFDGNANKVQAAHWRVHPEAKRREFMEQMVYRGAGPSFRYFYGQFDFEISAPRGER